MVLTLYKMEMSPAVRAVLMTIDALGLKDVKYVDLDLLGGEHLSEAFLKINPVHTVPTLVDDDFVIWDSHAICAYLVGAYGKDDSLYPKDLKKRAVVDQRMHFNGFELFATLREINLPILLEREKQFRPGTIEKIKNAYDLVNQTLKHQNKQWLAGDNVTLADICCVSTISTMNILHLPIDKEQYPHLWTWFQRCSQQPFYKNKNVPGLAIGKGVFASIMK